MGNPGTDSITAELLTANIELSAKKSIHCWEKYGLLRRSPTLRARANYQVAEKRKSQRMQKFERSNLLSVVGKVIVRIIIERVRNGVDRRLRKEQARYRKGQGTTDQIFFLSNIIEQVSK